MPVASRWSMMAWVLKSSLGYNLPVLSYFLHKYVAMTLDSLSVNPSSSTRTGTVCCGFSLMNSGLRVSPANESTYLCSNSSPKTLMTMALDLKEAEA